MQNRRNSYSLDDLLASSRGELFGPGYPQLPAPDMLMIDRVVKISRDEGNFYKGLVVAELDITPNLWFFSCSTDPLSSGFSFKVIFRISLRYLSSIILTRISLLPWLINLHKYL